MKNVTITIVLMLCVCVIGCKQQEEASTEMSADTSEESVEALVVSTLEVTDAMHAQLAAADKADGTTDNVIEKCVMCKLEMEGQADFAVAVADYSAQLCSSVCKEMFEKDPAKALLALAEK